MKLYLLILILLNTQILFAQKRNIRRDDYKVMIDSAVSIIANEYFSKYFNKSDTVLVIREDNTPWPTENIGIINLKSKNIYDSAFKALLAKGVEAWKLFPRLNGNTMQVSIIFFTITYKDNDYYFANGGGARVLFKYSCIKKKWIFQTYKVSEI